MEQMVNDIQAIISTLESLNITPTYDNMSKLLGCMQVLEGIRDKLKDMIKAQTAQPVETEANDGTQQ